MSTYLLVNLPNPHPRALAQPFTPKVLQAREHAPTPSLSVVFTFGFTVESIRELGGASHGIRSLVELDSLIGEFQWH